MKYIIVVCDAESKSSDTTRYLKEAGWTDNPEEATHFDTRAQAVDYLREKQIPIGAHSMYPVPA